MNTKTKAVTQTIGNKLTGYAALFLMGVAFVLMITFTYEANAQTNWVVCENPVNGQTQSFPNRCPSGWIFISN